MQFLKPFFFFLLLTVRLSFSQEMPLVSSNEALSAPCVIVIFGASGDLTMRKLLPALYNLVHEGCISSNLRIVGVSHRDITHEAFRRKMREGVNQFSRNKVLDPIWDDLEKKLFYHQADFNKKRGYQALKDLLAEIDKDFGGQSHKLYYLATAPRHFPTIVENLHAHDLIYNPHDPESKWSRVIVEKPFGYDLETAALLHEALSRYLDKSQTYRIDHYLGKEGVQNLLSLRFNSGLFEPLWNNQHIDNVQITLSEEDGIGTRGHFWEETGYLRDIVQNHLLQLLAITAMEPPLVLDAEHIGREKIKALRAIRPFPPNEIASYVVRGQYGPGTIKSLPVAGYIQENDVPKDSNVETYVAAKLFIDNKRWSGVPFYIRGGKRLPKSTAQIVLTFKKNDLSSAQMPNALFIRIQQNPGVFFKTTAKVPGAYKNLSPVTFGYHQEEAFGRQSPEAYEKLIYDCMLGDKSLFVEAEEQLTAWTLLNPIFQVWKMQQLDSIPMYDAGSWGPLSADELLHQSNHQWLLLN